jgi:hypothetical protein
MSWLFSQALVEASLGDVCSVGEPFAQLNVTPTAQPFWRNDKTMEPSRLSRFGLTLRLLAEPFGKDVLMSFLEDFPARTSASLAPELESTANAPVFGESSHGWYAKYDLVTSMWKTAQCSLLQDSEEFSETWPRWGSMRNGVSYLRPIPELGTSENESGFLPTPCAQMGGYNQSDSRNSKVRPSLEMMARHNLWPTPCAIDWRDAAHPTEFHRNTPSLATHAGGPLNPTWVEWLMGWPIGWTALKPLETAKFQEWQQQHGGCSVPNEDAA